MKFPAHGRVIKSLRCGPTRSSNHETPHQKTGVILETEGSIWKMQKRALFHYKTVKKGTPNLISPYVHGLFATVWIKQFF